MRPNLRRHLAPAAGGAMVGLWLVLAVVGCGSQAPQADWSAGNATRFAARSRGEAASAGPDSRNMKSAELADLLPAAKDRSESPGPEALTDTLGEALSGDYDKAAGTFQRLSAAYASAGDKARAAEALFWYAYCRQRQGRRDEARKAYGQVMQRYPDTPAGRQALGARTRLDAERLP